MPGAGARPPAAQSKDWPGLAVTLARFDDDRLARLLSLRPDLASPAPRDMAALASRAGSWPGARDSLAGLDRSAQRVVETLCLLPQPATVADVAALLAVAADDADLAGALARLEERALAFPLAPAKPGGQGGRVRLLPALAQLDYPARLGPSLASVLAGHPGPVLDQIAVRLGLRPAKTKAATVPLLVAFLSDPEHVAALVLQGPEGTADLARRVATEGPGVNVRGGLYSADDRTPAGWLYRRGMLGIVDYYSAVMPREPAIALRGGTVFPPGALRHPAPRVGPVDAEVVERTAAEHALRVVADVAGILDAWATEPPAVLKSGGIGVRELRRAAKLTGRTEVEVARVVELAAIARLVRVDPMSAVALPTASYDTWLALDAPGRWAWLAEAWVGTDLHLNLAGAIGTNDKPIPPLLARGGERHAARRRERVLAMLAETGPGLAAEPASVHDQVDWGGPGLWAGGPATPAMLVSWVLQEASLLGVAALGALSTAGRAVVAGRPDAAAAALADLAPPAVSEFVIQADLTAMIAGEPSPDVRAELDLLADVESQGAATVYRFGEASLRRAFDAGRSAADILAFLEGHASRGVPQPLAYLIGDLGRRFGNVRVGPATTYLRSDDPSLLAEIRQAKRTAKLRLRQLAPTVLVSASDAPTVVATLQAAGYLPARESADGALLLGRPARRRLPDRPASKAASPYQRHEPDVVAIVSALRRAPLPGIAPKPAAAGPLPAPRTAPPWEHLRLMGPPRPTGIAKDPRAIRGMLRDACEEYWVVRMAWVDDAGLSTELTVEPVEIDTEDLYAACFPDAEEQAFELDRIEWVRVLTEAEEDLLP